MDIALLVPAPFSTISGGYNYDRRIVAGLMALGHAVQVVELAGRHPLPDAAAEAAARAALEAIPDGTRIIIDGLGLPSFALLADSLEARGAMGLIHHPTALETGFPEEDRAALRGLEQSLFPSLARIIAPSALTTRRLTEDFAVAPDRLAIVEPGTDPAPRATGSGGEGCAILSVGMLVPRKGHDVLLRALARLTDLDWHLTIAGAARDAVHAHGLTSLAAELGIEARVTFAGECDAAALDALYATSDLFALATHWEGYGMAAAEAMARGLPLAITAGGAIAEIVAPGAAVIVQPGDHTALSRAIRRVIYDRDLRADMAEASWQGGQSLPRWPDRAQQFAAAIEAAR
ncbi:glycosyltransferase family 4 protein [Plastoroseomonas arctica]|uniref:Glycosyltransferase family 4 protein n=1 Tax=Plastoroseomonas arctica TaxID=1509237 RepID=A0AAF1JXV8_9PROT|nr:glycosyltransferase family 4 protein [Plastoroseomonas arctica]MBR0656177.1 glycosyltransferase family 4 protein [Plastoroseomonas arctica]